ncbi:hypothetical protein APU11_20575 [Enterobacter sp. 50793107]|nr:hypothetical protein SD66_06520 [Enterobacter cloacae]KSY77716.1 hypothetical protein APU11_20575 [Enterobacter sp. 50793107]KTH17665.1 hypothetical protein ASV29_05500 [Enterobacter cloacae subsp. cloacae]KTH21059.1 hypothetical protein ASV28_04725 [Enterobacter cloacae subsp. cloacae]PCM73073.1 hypothetical protein CP904_03675 [Enterobacter cloacae]
MLNIYFTEIPTEPLSVTAPARLPMTCGRREAISQITYVINHLVWYYLYFLFKLVAEVFYHIF